MSTLHPKGKSQATKTANIVKAVRMDIENAVETLKIAEQQYRNGDSGAALSVDLAFDRIAQARRCWSHLV